MVHLDRSVKEETLDPENWERMRALGHRMVDDMLDYLEGVRQRPVWQPVPNQVKESFQQAVPQEGLSPEQVYQEFVERVLPYPMGNIHPRFWGWVMGSGTVMGMLAEMLAAGMNPNCGGGDHGAKYVEIQVLEWCKDLLGFPPDSSGLLVSGGSMANLVGLTAARNTQAGYDLRKEGLQGRQQRLIVYGSREMHSSIQKAVELLGMGSESLRLIPTNAEYQMEIGALEEAITADREAGYQPLCVVGNAGTVNTGAFDDLERLADLCQAEGLWFHVDGAFGALAALAPDLRRLVAGMERADSLAFDLHKWMYMPFEAGCVLVRREDDQRRSFSLTPDYLVHAERGVAGGSTWFSDYGIQLTRGFRALKVWMSLMEHGVEKYGRLIQQNVNQARYLADLVDETPDLERLAPVPLNIVCFRYHPGGIDEPQLNQLNQEILLQLHESGVAVPTYTTLNGKYALRAAITNHRSQYEDFDIMVRAVLRIGNGMAGGS